MIVPQSDVYLLKCPLEIDDLNQLTFANVTAQHNYFNSLPKIGFDDFTYQRKDDIIRIPALIDDIHSYNYVMYRNDAYSNKWFYAFIEGMEYLNDSVTAVKIKLDVYQSWQFELTYKPSFVEREHVNNDTIGANTVPENLETGDYINQPTDQPAISGHTPSNEINFLNDDCLVVIGTTDTQMDVARPDNNYNGIFSGIVYITFKTFNDANTFIDYLHKRLSDDPIVTIFMCPKKLTGLTSTDNWYTYSWIEPISGATYTFDYHYIVPNSSAIELSSTSISKPTTLDGYQPKNNKMLCFPYQFLDISNNAGNNNIYHYELFKGGGSSASATCNFKIYGAISTGCSIQCIPINYNKTTQATWGTTFNNYEEALDAGKLPTCAWANDTYTNWLTQNAVNIGLNLAGDVAKIAIGAGVAIGGAGFIGSVAGAGVGVGSMAMGGTMALGGVTGVADTVKQIYERSLVPPSARGGSNQGELMYAQKRSFTIYKKTIKREYARICDNYMSMYGYKVNSLKIPNVTGRRNWNYVKTIGCYIEADIPQTDLNEIKLMFDKGITFWHNPSTFMDYSQNNDII